MRRLKNRRQKLLPALLRITFEEFYGSRKGSSGRFVFAEADFFVEASQPFEIDPGVVLGVINLTNENHVNPRPRESQQARDCGAIAAIVSFSTEHENILAIYR